jgi:Glu-tRNA(Gln) amidotransferase subunit E-like FAD-binding protein
MNFGDDEFKQAVQRVGAWIHWQKKNPVNESSADMAKDLEMLLAAQETIEELKKQVGDSRIYAQSLAACLAEKDKALAFYGKEDRYIECRCCRESLNEKNHTNIHRDKGRRARDILAINPNKYQERVRARDRVIEAARETVAYYLIQEINAVESIQKALAELDKLEGASSKEDPHPGRTDSCL